MSEFTRKASLFGGPKVVLGTESADLVLETLGKIYVKTGKKARLLNDVFKLLDNLNDPKEDVGGKTFIVETLSDLLNTFKYPGDGYLIFVSQEQSLYISYDDRYLLLIEEVVDPTNNTTTEENAPGFVRRRGDRMTGQLEIAVGDEKAPLIIASSKLVENLNVQFLNGYASHELAIKKLNEYILGNWTFEKDTQFNANVNVASDITVGNNSYVHGNQEVGYDLLVKNKATVKLNIHAEKDIVLTGSIGSPEFMSGYNGYGWRFDADTNMLTVDYLVVRKAMQVFELIVNRIQATNGSLWVTDSCEVKEITEITYQAVETTTLNKTNFLAVASIQNEVNLKKDYLNIAKNIFTYSGNLLANTSYATDALYFIENEYFNLLDQHKDKFPILEVQHLCTTYNNLYSNYTDNVYEVPSVTQIRLPLGGASIKIMSSNVSSLKINGLNVDDLTELIFINNSSNNYNNVATVTVEAELEEGTTEWMYSIGYHYSEILQQILDCQVTNYFYLLFSTPNVIDNPIGIDDLKDRSTFESKIQTLESNIEGLEAQIANYHIKSTIDLPKGVWIALNRLEQSIHGKYLKSVNGVFEDEDVIFYTHSHIVKINDYNKVLTMINNRLSNLNVDDVLTPTSFLQLVLCNPSTDDVEFRLQLLETKNADNNPIIQCVETINPEFYNAVMFSTDNKLEIDTLEEITVLKTYYKYFGLTKERQDLLESNILANTYIVKMKDDSYATFDTGDIIRCQKFEDHSVKYYDALVGSRIDAYTYVIIKSPSVFDTQVTISTDGDGNLSVSTELNLNQYNKTFNGYYRESNVTYYKLNGIDINYTPIVFSYMYNTRQLDRSEKPLFIDNKYIEDINDIKFSLFTKTEVTNIDNCSTVFKDLSGNYFKLSTEDFTLVPAFTGTYIELRYVSINGSFYMVDENDKIIYFGNEYEVVDNKVTIGEHIFNVLQDTYTINPIIEGDDSRIVTLIKYNGERLPNEDFICYILSGIRVSLAEDGLVVEYYQAPTADGLESERVQASRVIAEIAPKDGLVRVGNLTNAQRQNSVFITSSEWDSPYVQTMSGVCRPDYTVAYKQPKFSKWKVRTATNSIRFKFLYKSTEAVADKIYLLPTEEEFIQSVLDKATYTTLTEILKCVVKLYFDGFKFNNYYYTFVDSIPNNDANAYEKFEIETTQVIDNLTGEVSTKYLATYCDHIKARFGKLDGIEHENFSRNNLTQPHGYGLYGENVYLTGEFVLSNGKSIATIGDDILFKVAESGLHITEDGIVLDADKIQINNGEKVAALFKDGKILATYIDVKDISTDRLIAKKYGFETSSKSIDFQYTDVVTNTAVNGVFTYETKYFFVFENTTYEVCGFDKNFLEEWPSTKLSPRITTNFTYKYTSVNTIYITLILYVADENSNIYKFKYYYNSSLDKLKFSEAKEPITGDAILNIEPIKVTDTIKIIGENMYTLEEGCNLPYVQVNTESTSDVLTINKHDLGEIILYWPNGSIKYVRLENSDDENISQYVEYWYGKDKCTLSDIKLGIDYLDRKGGYQKRLDALENPFVIDRIANFYSTNSINDVSADKKPFIEWLSFWLSILNDYNLNWYYEVATNPLKVLATYKVYAKKLLEEAVRRAPEDIESSFTPPTYNSLLGNTKYVVDVYNNVYDVQNTSLRIYVPTFGAINSRDYYIYEYNDSNYISYSDYMAWLNTLTFKNFPVEYYNSKYWALLSENSDPVLLTDYSTNYSTNYGYVMDFNGCSKEYVHEFGNYLYKLETLKCSAMVYESVQINGLWYPVYPVFGENYGLDSVSFCIAFKLFPDSRGIPTRAVFRHKGGGAMFEVDPITAATLDPTNKTVLFRSKTRPYYNGIFLNDNTPDVYLIVKTFDISEDLKSTFKGDFDSRITACKKLLENYSVEELKKIQTFVAEKIKILIQNLPNAISFMQNIYQKFNALTRYTRDHYSNFVNSIVIPDEFKKWFYADPNYFEAVSDMYVYNNNLLIPQFDLHVRSGYTAFNGESKDSYIKYPKYQPFIKNVSPIPYIVQDKALNFVRYLSVHDGTNIYNTSMYDNAGSFRDEAFWDNYFQQIDTFSARQVQLKEPINQWNVFTVNQDSVSGFVKAGILYHTNGLFEWCDENITEYPIYTAGIYGEVKRIFKEKPTWYYVLDVIIHHTDRPLESYSYFGPKGTFIIDGRIIESDTDKDEVLNYLTFKYKTTATVESTRRLIESNKEEVNFYILNDSFVMCPEQLTLQTEYVTIDKVYWAEFPLIRPMEYSYSGINADYPCYDTLPLRQELSAYYDLYFNRDVDGRHQFNLSNSAATNGGYYSNSIMYSFNGNIENKNYLKFKISAVIHNKEEEVAKVYCCYKNGNKLEWESKGKIKNAYSGMITNNELTFTFNMSSYLDSAEVIYIIVVFSPLIVCTITKANLLTVIPDKIVADKEIKLTRNSFRGLLCALTANCLTSKYQLGIKQLYTYFKALMAKAIYSQLQNPKALYTLQTFGKSEPLVYTTYLNYKGLDVTTLYFKQQWANIANLILGKNKISSYNNQIVENYAEEFPLLVLENGSNNIIVQQSVDLEIQQFDLLVSEFQLERTPRSENTTKMCKNKRWLTWDGPNYESICYTTDTFIANFIYNKSTLDTESQNYIQITASQENTEDNTNKWNAITLFKYNANTGIPEDGVLFCNTDFKIASQYKSQMEKFDSAFEDSIWFNGIDISHMSMYEKEYNAFPGPKEFLVSNKYTFDIYAMLFEKSISAEHTNELITVRSSKLDVDYDYDEKAKLTTGVAFLATDTYNTNSFLYNNNSVLFQIADGAEISLTNFYYLKLVNHGYTKPFRLQSGYNYREGPMFYTNLLTITSEDLQLPTVFSKNYIYIMYSEWELVSASNSTLYWSGDGRFYNGLVATEKKPSNYYSGNSFMNILYSPYCEDTLDVKLLRNDGYYTAGNGKEVPIIMDALHSSSQLTNFSEKDWYHPGDINSGLVVHLKNLFKDKFYYYIGALSSMDGSVVYKPDKIGETYNGWYEIDLSKATETGYLLNKATINLPKIESTTIIPAKLLFPIQLADGYVQNGYSYTLKVFVNGVEVLKGSDNTSYGYISKGGIECNLQDGSGIYSVLTNDRVKFILYKTKVE